MSLAVADSIGRTNDRERDNTVQKSSQSDVVRRAESVQHKVISAANNLLSNKIISTVDAKTMTANIDSAFQGGEDLANWERFVREAMPSQIQKYKNVRTKFVQQMTEAKSVISDSSFREWSKRFDNTTYQERQYFVDYQFPEFLRNWKAAISRREPLAKKAKGALDGNDIANFDALFNAEAFRQLSFEKKKALIGEVEAALNSGTDGLQALHTVAKQKLNAAKAFGAMSGSKVGVWLQRIFAGSHTKKEIREFVMGSGDNSLDTLIGRWKAIAVEFGNVCDDYQRAEHTPRGFTLIDLDAFLKMDYPQRVSYVEEARRTLETAKNPEKEVPILLEIRHHLDAKDWEEADIAIRKANGMDLEPTDRSRLDSMRNFLVLHRTDGGVPVESTGEDVQMAKERIDAALSAMHPSMAAMAAQLLPYGNSAINNFYWSVRNNSWCEEHGYLDSDSAITNFEEHKDDSEENAKRWEDRGLYDYVKEGDENLIRDEEDQMNAEVKATYQYANISDVGARGTLASWYKKQPPKVLYWTTFVAVVDGSPMSCDWHLHQMKYLKEIRAASRIIQNAGFIYSGPGKPLFSVN